jgi:hypothetical protein
MISDNIYLLQSDWPISTVVQYSVTSAVPHHNKRAPKVSMAAPSTDDDGLPLAPPAIANASVQFGSRQRGRRLPSHDSLESINERCRVVQVPAHAQP